MRYSSIDLLRTFAIFVMVTVHFSENLAGVVPRISGLGAPLFLFLSGVSYRLWLNSRLARGDSETRISQVTVRRGLFLFGLGFVFNALVWLPEDTFNWDVLTLIGVGFFAMNLGRRLPDVVTLAFCAMVFALSPALRQSADWTSFWTQGYFDPDLTLSDVLLGFFAVGYFPVFPWVIYPLVGLVVGTSVFGQSRAAAPDSRALRRGFVVGIGLIGLAATLVLIRRFAPQIVPERWLAGWTMFPPSTVYVIGTLGFVCASFCGGYQLFDQWLAPERLQRVRQAAGTFSRHSLSIYVLHHIAHLWPLWIHGHVTVNDPTYYWRQAVSVPTSIALAFVFLPCCYLLFRALDKANVGGIESWMRWICD